MNTVPFVNRRAVVMGPGSRSPRIKCGVAWPGRRTFAARSVLISPRPLRTMPGHIRARKTPGGIHETVPPARHTLRTDRRDRRRPPVACTGAESYALSVIVFPGGFNWPIWAAQEQGYFARGGVEVK